MIAYARRPHHRRRAFTVLEFLTTLAFLVVVLGVLVSLARYVRASSAQEVTRRTLAELEETLKSVSARNAAASTLPAEFAVAMPASVVDENQFQQYVQRIGVPLVQRLAALARERPGNVPAEQGGPFREQVVRDAWGNPIAFLPGQHPAIGMAPQNRPFFVSAGPDGRYLTREDNLYSYEQMRFGPVTTMPAPPAVGGGQGE